MEIVPMLQEVDEEKHYSQLLEVAYVEAYWELDSILKRSNFDMFPDDPMSDREADMIQTCTDLARMRYTMNCTVKQSVERRRRLAHIARGLSDVVLDEEGAEK